ncbi:MAG: bifunctional oligoribonuclease/PAP phosphatase NrnA [bacterium]|nr:bifunctional oligoribonuclease/PAP phosphatase NrnA [bacterium]
MSPSQSILAQLLAATNVLIVTHQDPDFDAIGSSLALYWALKKQGKAPTVWVPQVIAENYDCLPGIESRAIAFPSDTKFDLIVALDAARKERIAEWETLPNLPIINIDHHQDNPEYGDTNHVVRISSVGELLTELFSDWKWPLSTDIATCLYAAIAFDTSRFQYNSVTPDTHRRAASLLEHNINHTRLNESIFERKDHHYFSIIKSTCDNMIVDHDYGICYTKLTNLPDTMGSEIIDFIRQQEGMAVYAVFRTTESGDVKVSLRSKLNFDVAAFAAQFGGGGHKMAAGIRLTDISLDEAITRVITALKKEVK